MKILVCIISLIFATSIVAQEEYDSRAIALNSQAVELARYGFNKDSLAKALNLLDTAIALDKKYPMAYYNKLSWLASLEKWDDYEQCLYETINNFPDKPHLYMHKALYLEWCGNRAEARKVYNFALEFFETKLKENPTSGLIVDYVAAKYLANGQEMSKSEIEALIPDSFSAEERKRVATYLPDMAELKRLKEKSVKDEE